MSEQEKKTVAVTGATGFVGRHVCRELMSRGWGVRALARSRGKVGEAFGDSPPVIVHGDVRDGRALGELMIGCCAVAHCIGIRHEVRPEITFQAMHVEATQEVVDAARGAKATRFVHISALGTRANANNDYQRSKYRAEQIVKASGLDWTILRPSLIHGPQGEFLGMVRDWVLSRSAPRHFIPYFAKIERDPDNPLAPPSLESSDVQPVCVHDVAKSVCESLERDIAIHEVYPLVGPDVMSWPEVLYAVRDALPMTHENKKVRGIPAPLGLAMARGAELVGMGNALPFGPSEPSMAMEDSVAPTTKFAEHLGIVPSPFVESLQGYAHQI